MPWQLDREDPMPEGAADKSSLVALLGVNRLGKLAMYLCIEKNSDQKLRQGRLEEDVIIYIYIGR